MWQSPRRQANSLIVPARQDSCGTYPLKALPVMAEDSKTPLFLPEGAQR